MEEEQGIIPRALADIFNEVRTITKWPKPKTQHPKPKTQNLTIPQVNARSVTSDISVRVSFLEIYNENIRCDM